MSKNIEEVKKILKEKTIHLVAYGHCDFSWVHTRLWHINRYVTMMKEALDILNSTKEYQYCADCYSMFLEPIFDRHPEFVEDLQKHVKSGRFVFCGTYSNIRPNMVDGEAFIRNMVIGRKKFLEKFPDAEIIVYGDTCDVAASHTQLPQLIKNGGYQFFRFARPGDVLTLKGLPHDFIFKGMDGTCIVTSMASTAGFWNRETVPPIFDEDIDKSILALYETEFEDLLPNFTSNVIMKGNGCDDGIPLQFYHPSGRIPLMEQINKYREAGININFSTPNKYFLELDKRENKEKLKVIDYCYDIADVSFNVCLGGEQSLQNKRLRSATAILAAEKFDAFKHLVGIETSNTQNFDKFWEENLYCSAHASQWSYQEDYDNLTMRANRVIDRANESREISFIDITRNQRFSDNTVAVVFNTHDKSVKRTIRLTITTPDPQKLQLIDAFNHELTFMPVRPYIFSFMETTVSEWDFAVTIDIPPHGYNSIIVKEGRLDIVERVMWDDIEHKLPRHIDFSTTKTCIIENQVLKLSFEDGNLKEIVDKRTNSQAKSNNAFNELCFYEYSNIKIEFPVFEIGEIHKIVWKSCDIVFNENIYAEMILTGSIKDHLVKQTITINADIAEIHFETEFDYKNNDNGIVLFNMPCEDIETLYAGIPFGTEPRRVDLEPYRNKDTKKAWDDIGGLHRTIDGLFYAKDFIACKSGSLKLSLVTPTGDRYFLYDKHNKTVGHIVNATVKISEGWEENINKTAFSSYGKHIFNHTLSVFESVEELYMIQQNAEGLCVPVEYVRPLSGGQGEMLPLSMSFLSVNSDNVRISAFYRHEEGYIVRIWEAAKTETKSKLVFPVNIKSVEQVDFNGKIIQNNEIELIEGVIHFTIKPSQIMTLKITLF